MTDESIMRKAPVWEPFLLFLDEPVLHVLGFALALEVELDVVEGVANLLKWSFWIEVGVVRGEQLTDVPEAPPGGLFSFFRTTEGLTNHFYQVVQVLIRLVFCYQRGYLAVVQPETLTFVKQMEGLGKELIMIEIILEIDIAIYTHTDESTTSRWIDEGFQLVGGTNKRGVATILLDGLAVRWTELHIARREQILQHDLLRVRRLIELIDVDKGKRGQSNIQIELVLEVDLIIVIISQFLRQQNLTKTCLSTTLATNQQWG